MAGMFDDVFPPSVKPDPSLKKGMFDEVFPAEANKPSIFGEPKPPKQETPKPESASIVDTVTALPRGLIHGVTRGLPEMAGKSLEFIGGHLPGAEESVQTAVPNVGSKETPIPKVSEDGSRMLSDQEAINQTQKLDSVEEDNSYTEQLHKDQAKQSSVPEPGNVVQKIGRAVSEFNLNPVDFGSMSKTDLAAEKKAEESRKGIESLLYQVGDMLGPSVIPGVATSMVARTILGVGKLAKAARAAELAGDLASKEIYLTKATQLAKIANETGGLGAAALFGGSQAQHTVEATNTQVAKLESEGKHDEAKALKNAAFTKIAPYLTGAIEAAGEYFGTKYLGKLFRLDEAEVAKKLTTGELVNNLLKTMGVEVGTEMGQQFGEAGVEKLAGIRPGAQPWEETKSVILPTTLMTLLTAGLAHGSNKLAGRLSQGQTSPTEIKDVIGKVREEHPDLMAGYTDDEVFKVLMQPKTGAQKPLSMVWSEFMQDNGITPTSSPEARDAVNRAWFESPEYQEYQKPVLPLADMPQGMDLFTGKPAHDYALNGEIPQPAAIPSATIPSPEAAPVPPLAPEGAAIPPAGPPTEGSIPGGMGVFDDAGIPKPPAPAPSESEVSPAPVTPESAVKPVEPKKDNLSPLGYKLHQEKVRLAKLEDRLNRTKTPSENLKKAVEDQRAIVAEHQKTLDTAKTSRDEKMAKTLFDGLGLKYDGIQNDADGKPLAYIVVDPETNSSHMIKLDEATPEHVIARLEKSREDFKKGGEKNAEKVRGDEEKVQEGGPARPGGEGESGPDIQQPKEIEPETRDREQPVELTPEVKKEQQEKADRIMQSILNGKREERRSPDRQKWDEYDKAVSSGDTEKAREIAKTLAYQDRLTGLTRREGWEHEESEGRLDKYPNRFFMDLDNFHDTNEKLTHLGGDRVLAEVGKTIKEHLGTDSEGARWGGDEFVGAGHENLSEKLAAIQKDLENLVIQIEIPEGSEYPKGSGHVLDAPLTIEQKGIRLSFGIGKSYEEAYNENTKSKEERKAAGLRHERGEKPADTGSAVEEPAKGVKVPEREEKEVAHDYSSTQVNLPKEDAKEILEFGKSIPDSEIYTDPNDPTVGREDKPHITVKYGIHTENAEKIKKLLEGTGTVTAKLGKIDVFSPKDKPYDVVIVPVDSPELHDLNAKVSEGTKVTDTFPEYKPHITIAYVKKGEGAKYKGDARFEGKEISFDKVHFTDKDENATPIRLETPETKPEDVDVVIERVATALKKLVGAEKAFHYKNKEHAAAFKFINSMRSWMSNAGNDAKTAATAAFDETTGSGHATEITKKIYDEAARAIEKQEGKPTKPETTLTVSQRNKLVEEWLNKEDWPNQYPAEGLHNLLKDLGVLSKTTEKIWEDARRRADPNKDYGEAFRIAAEHDLDKWAESNEPIPQDNIATKYGITEEFETKPAETETKEPKGETKESKKAPWQIPREEYASTTSEGKPIEVKEFQDHRRQTHEREVRMALEKGEAVPTEVLKDYPDLINPKGEQKPVKTETPKSEIAINDIPKDLEITTTAIREKTGRKVKIKENAREAFARMKESLESIKGVLNCLK